MADTIAGRFTLLEPIATGGSGTVWFAHDRKLESICAAKVLRQRDSADLLRFVRENNVRIDHPHVLAPYAWAAEDADVVLAMPVITGGTLAGVLADNGPLSPALVAEIVRQVLDGLAHIHASGWIHRDLKPANIMVDAEVDYPHVLIADFGIAIHRDEPRLTETGVVYGTPGFLSPEVFDGADPATTQDIWAVGAIAWSLLGSTPRAHALERQHIREGLTRRYPGAATAALLDVLDSMVAPDPTRRPSAAAARDAIPQPPAGEFYTADGEVFSPLRVLEAPTPGPDSGDAPSPAPEPGASPPAPDRQPAWPRTLVLPARPDAQPPRGHREPPRAPAPGPPATSVPPAPQAPGPASWRPHGAPVQAPAPGASTRAKRGASRGGWVVAGALALTGVVLVGLTLVASAMGWV